jgi:guanylate kinase
MIGTLEAYEQIRNYYGEKAVVPIYIEVEDGLRLERALHRERSQENPKYKEMCRRYLADEEDFSEENLSRLKIDRRYENKDITVCLNEIIQDINQSGAEDKVLA